MEKDEILAIKFGKWLQDNVYHHDNMNEARVDSTSRMFFKKPNFSDAPWKALNMKDWYALFLEHRAKLKKELSLTEL